jgi:hypothetical protein
MTQAFTDFTDLDAEEISHDEFLASGFGDADDAAEQQQKQSENYDQPNPDFVKAAPRKRNAATYEKKVNGLLQVPLRFAIQHEATLPDAAALLMEGPKIGRAFGDWAAEDERIARSIDWLTSGSDNPAAAAMLALAPLVFQIIRNHEPQLETQSRGIRLPGKDKNGEPRRLRFRFGVKLGRLRPLTNDPDKLARHVFTNPKMRAALEKNGIVVQEYGTR